MSNKLQYQEIKREKLRIKGEIIETIRELRKREENGEIGVGINRTVNELARKYLLSPTTIYVWCRKENPETVKERKLELERHIVSRSETERQMYVYRLRGKISMEIDKYLNRLNSDGREMFITIVKDRYGKELNEKEKAIISLAESAPKEIKEEKKRKEILDVWDKVSPEVKEDGKDVKARAVEEGDIPRTFRVEVKGEIVGKDLTEEEAEKLSDEWEEKGFNRIKDVDILEE